MKELEQQIKVEKDQEGLHDLQKQIEAKNKLMRKMIHQKVKNDLKI